MKRVLKYLRGRGEAIASSSMAQHCLFIHIPKTAGTSFRTALEKSESVICDYGKDSKDTHPLISEKIYKDNDFFSFNSFLEASDNKWISGHVNLNKYLDLVDIRNTVVFLRSPVEQVTSHFNHFVSYKGFSGDLDEFLSKGLASDFQSKYLNQFPISLLGYVGITECYEESLSGINNYLGQNYVALSKNVNNSKSLSSDSLGNDIITRVLEQNEKDELQYQAALKLHQQRLNFQKENKEWVFSHFTINNNQVLNGCAYYEKSDEAVELDVYCDEQLFKTITANQFYGGYAKAQFPRKRYIGINIPLKKITQSGSEIKVIVRSTKQLLTDLVLK